MTSSRNWTAAVWTRVSTSVPSSVVSRLGAVGTRRNLCPPKCVRIYSRRIAGRRSSASSCTPVYRTFIKRNLRRAYLTYVQVLGFSLRPASPSSSTRPRSALVPRKTNAAEAIWRASGGRGWAKLAARATILATTDSTFNLSDASFRVF